MCFYCFLFACVCVRICLVEIHLFTIRPFPRKKERMPHHTPAWTIRLSTNIIAWFHDYAYALHIMEPIQFIIFLSILIWWLIDEFNFVKPIFYSSKWKSFRSFPWTMNICIQWAWQWLQNINTVNSLNIHIWREKDMRRQKSAIVCARSEFISRKKEEEN